VGRVADQEGQGKAAEEQGVLRSAYRVVPGGLRRYLGFMSDARMSGMEGKHFYICYLGQGCIMAFGV